LVHSVTGPGGLRASAPNSRSAPACNCSERCPTAPVSGRWH